MLKRFYVDNYKTHINTTYELAPINLLVGENNSGKTNICQAMKFCAASTLHPLAKAATLASNEEWTLTNIHFEKTTIDFRVEADLSYLAEELSFTYELTVKLLDMRVVRQLNASTR